MRCQADHGHSTYRIMSNFLVRNVLSGLLLVKSRQQDVRKVLVDKGLSGLLPVKPEATILCRYLVISYVQQAVHLILKPQELFLQSAWVRPRHYSSAHCKNKRV